MFKGDKYFKLMEVIKSPEVMLAYKNQNFLLTYPTGLVNKGFALLLTFSSTLIFFRLSILSDALLGRRSYNNVLIVFKIRFLF
jgi:hypothetical protein